MELSDRRPLRGVRYILPGREDLAEFVYKELPFLDYNEALEFYKLMATESWVKPEDHAFVAMNDRYYLLTFMLNRVDMLHPWLYDRCREVEAAPDGYLDLWARGHGKSSIITFAGVIQEVLENPELRVCIFTMTVKAAKDFLVQIKNEFETNDKLMACFPDVLWEKPAKQAPKWSISDGIVLKRAGNPREATVEAHSLLAQPTGKHFPLLVYDDALDGNAVTNDDMISKVSDQWAMSNNLGITTGDTRRWGIGTRYSYADTYGQLMAEGAFLPRLYAATEDGTMNGKLVLMSPEKWEEHKRTQRQTIASQMLQNPLAGSENTFQPDHLRFWEIRPGTMNVYIMVDPSSGKKSKKGDRTAMIVVGMDANRNKYVLDGFCHRMSLSEKWDNLKGLYRKWSGSPGIQHVKIGYEQYGMQADMEYIKEKMAINGPFFPIEELAWPREGGHSKDARIGRLEPDMRYSSLYFPAVVYHDVKSEECLWHVDENSGEIVYRPLTAPTKIMKAAKNTGQEWRIVKPIKRRNEDGKVYDVTRMLLNEILFHPFATHDDAVDALSRIYDMDPVPPVDNDESPDGHFDDVV